jgi:cleavage stimulation factor subunit 3
MEVKIKIEPEDSPREPTEKRKKPNKWQLRIQKNQWDTVAWTSLLAESQKASPAVARETFELFLAHFPTSVRIHTYVLRKLTK